VYTRCQACHTVHPVNAALLAQGGGKYRCGKCKKVGNALEALFDEWPQASQQGPRPGDLPELGLNLSLGPGNESASALNESDSENASATENTSEAYAGWPLHRLVLAGAALLLALIIALGLAGFFQKPLPDLSRLQSTLVRLGLTQAPPEPPFRAPDRIEVLSRELKAHPHRQGVLVLTATIANRAERAQPYPTIDVTLLDTDSRPTSHQVFGPGDYLTRSSGLRDGMQANAILSLSLEIEDPGDGAAGFQLEFH